MCVKDYNKTVMQESAKVTLTRQEIQAALGIGATSFWKLQILGVFRPLKYLARKKLYPREQLDAYLRSGDEKKEKQP